jgi:hypothetical protein
MISRYPSFDSLRLCDDLAVLNAVSLRAVEDPTEAASSVQALGGWRNS